MKEIIVGYTVKHPNGQYLQKGCSHFGKKPHVWPSKKVIGGRLKQIKKYLDNEIKEALISSEYIPVILSEKSENILFDLDWVK